jgi:hypothetical protein
VAPQFAGFTPASGSESLLSATAVPRDSPSRCHRGHEPRSRTTAQAVGCRRSTAWSQAVPRVLTTTAQSASRLQTDGTCSCGTFPSSTHPLGVVRNRPAVGQASRRSLDYGSGAESCSRSGPHSNETGTAWRSGLWVTNRGESDVRPSYGGAFHSASAMSCTRSSGSEGR